MDKHPLLSELSSTTRITDYKLLRNYSVENFKECWGLSINDLTQLIEPRDRFWNHYQLQNLEEKCQSREAFVTYLANQFDKHFTKLFQSEIEEYNQLFVETTEKIKELHLHLKAQKGFSGSTSVNSVFNVDTEIKSTMDSINEQEQIRNTLLRHKRQLLKLINLPIEDKAILFRFHELCVDGNVNINYAFPIHENVRFMWFTHVLFQYGVSVLKKIKDSLQIEELMREPVNMDLLPYFQTCGEILSKVYLVSRNTVETSFKKTSTKIFNTVFQKLKSKTSPHK